MILSLPIDLNRILESTKKKKTKMCKESGKNICYRSGFPYQFAFAKETKSSLLNWKGRLLSCSRSKHRIFIRVNHLNLRSILQWSFFPFHKRHFFSLLLPRCIWTIIFTFQLVRTDTLINTFLRTTESHLCFGSFSQRILRARQMRNLWYAILNVQVTHQQFVYI